MTNPNPNPLPEPGAALSTVRAFGRLMGRISRPSGLILAAAWYGFIFTISSQQDIGRPGMITGDWVMNAGHSLLFGLLALCILLGLPRREGWPVLRPASAGLVLGIVLVLGVLDELHQGTVPGRHMAATDVITDVTGAVCVVWMCAYAGVASASERGTRARLVIGIAACCLAGVVATLADDYLS